MTIKSRTVFYQLEEVECSCGAGQSLSDQDPTSRLFHRRKNKILANMVQGVVFFLQLHIVHIRGKTGTARLY